MMAGVHEQARPHRFDPRLVFAAQVAAVAAFAIYNAYWLRVVAGWNAWSHTDWTLLVGLDPAQPYANPSFHWSVPAAWLWAGVVVPMGYLAWTALHFAALATLRDWRIIAAALVTFPFWFDVASGQVLTFCFVAAWHALNGHRSGVIAYCVLAALIPRPLMLPVLAVLLWRRTDARLAFAAASGFVVISALATGQLGTSIAAMLGTASSPWFDASWNLGPSHFLGAAWMPAGLVLAAWATWRGRLGLASLAISPYLIHYYAIFGLLELRPVQLVDRVVDRVRIVGLPVTGRAVVADVDESPARL